MNWRNWFAVFLSHSRSRAVLVRVHRQRSFAGCTSDVDRREAREVGEFALKQAIWGASDGSVAIRRVGDYAVEYALVELAKVAGKTRVMDDAFIAAPGSDITPAFRAYLQPLLGSDLPQRARLRGGATAKVTITAQIVRPADLRGAVRGCSAPSTIDAVW